MTSRSVSRYVRSRCQEECIGANVSAHVGLKFNLFPGLKCGRRCLESRHERGDERSRAEARAPL